MPLPNMNQLLEDALEHPLFLRLMEGRVHREHLVFGDNKLFLAGLLRHSLTEKGVHEDAQNPIAESF